MNNVIYPIDWLDQSAKKPLVQFWHIFPQKPLPPDRTRLNDSEAGQLRAIYLAHFVAKSNKNYAKSDQLRAELEDWGAIGDYTHWHPVFESPSHRKTRLEAR